MSRRLTPVFNAEAVRAGAAPRACSSCGELGHNARTCPRTRSDWCAWCGADCPGRVCSVACLRALRVDLKSEGVQS